MYTSQGQYYAATATGTAAATGAVGYTTSGHYLVQQAVDEGLIATAQQRTSPQTTTAVSSIFFDFDSLSPSLKKININNNSGFQTLCPYKKFGNRCSK